MSIFSSTDSAFIIKLTGIIHSNLENADFGVDELAHAAGVSRTALHRKLKVALDKHPCQFIREVRLKRAMEILCQGGVTAAEVAYTVGFGSPAYFNTCFHEFYGFTPGKVIKGELDESEITDQNTDSEFIHSSPNLLVRTTRSSRNLFILFLAFSLFLFSYIYLTSPSFIVNNPIVSSFGQVKIQKKSLAILPFLMMSKELDIQYAAFAIREGILAHLLKTKKLMIVSQVLAEQIRNDTLSAVKLADQQGVNYIVDGSIQRLDKKLMIIVHLNDAAQKTVIWSKNYYWDISDMVVMPNVLSKRISNDLKEVMK
ncbi:MAG: helix-turn-helix domain-containing protein [Prolixibacteraceae bacterium]